MSVVSMQMKKEVEFHVHIYYAKCFYDAKLFILLSKMFIIVYNVVCVTSYCIYMLLSLFIVVLNLLLYHYIDIE